MMRTVQENDTVETLSSIINVRRYCVTPVAYLTDSNKELLFILQLLHQSPLYCLQICGQP